MSKIFELADKFAMKLSLEPRPYAIPATDYEHTLEDLEPEYVPPARFLSERPKADTQEQLDMLRASVHNMGERIAMGQYQDTLYLISSARYDLDQLEKMIKHKMKHKKASIEEDGEDDDEGTIFRDIENEEPLPTEHLPAMLKEYLKDLEYMDKDQLHQERKRLMRFVKHFAQQGHKPPYLLKKRLEVVTNKLQSDSSRWF